MGIINIDEKALCSVIYGARDAATSKANENSIKIERLECELNLLCIKVERLEEKLNDTISNHLQ